MVKCLLDLIKSHTWELYDNKNNLIKELKSSDITRINIDGLDIRVTTREDDVYKCQTNYIFISDGKIECGGTRVEDYKDFVSGKPDRSGHYLTKHKGVIERDDFTTSNGGMWWNVSNDGTTLYSPSSYVEL